MVLDPHKRQKKLERKKAKQRVKNKAAPRSVLGNLAARLGLYAAAPILHCVAARVIWTEGIGNVLVSRELSNGNVAFAVFLVDLYCLGVKNAFSNVTPRHRYESELYGKMFPRYEPVELRPECARKLVEGAVDYARDLGLPPHPDYRAARLIFGDIDSAACPEEFVYGHEGKPFFVAGPHDDLARCKWIMSMLSQRCGAGNFDSLIRVSASEMPGGLEDYELIEEQRL